MTNNSDTGGPAFPEPLGEEMPARDCGCHPGMDLLDWFAGQALNGILSRFEPACSSETDTQAYLEGIYGTMSIQAYMTAEAMIAEKRRREGGGENAGV